MPVYVLREADTNYFKIGRTAGSMESVERRLRTGNPRPLRVVDLIETQDEAACEIFFHRMLQSRRIYLGGGTEFFEADPHAMSGSISHLKEVFAELEKNRAEVRQLAKAATEAVELPPTSEDERDRERLHLVRSQIRALQIESERLELRLKRRIGGASGIQGIASWKSQRRRCYNEGVFRQQNPQLYQDVLERYHCIDTSAWKKKDEDQYRTVQTTYFRSSVSRIFKLYPRR